MNAASDDRNYEYLRKIYIFPCYIDLYHITQSPPITQLAPSGHCQVVVPNCLSAGNMWNTVTLLNNSAISALIILWWSKAAYHSTSTFPVSSQRRAGHSCPDGLIRLYKVTHILLISVPTQVIWEVWFYDQLRNPITDPFVVVRTYSRNDLLPWLYL